MPGDDDSVATYLGLFAAEGYTTCDTADPEPGLEKIAVFAHEDGEFAHVARLRPDKVWVSKLGDLEDIEHPPMPATGTAYGTLRAYMRRPVDPRTQAPLPERFRLDRP